MRFFQNGLAVDPRRGFLLSFLFGFFVRLVPEVLSYPYPIGFDTVYYAARMKDGVVWYHWTSAFSTWLIYGILVSAYKMVQVDPFLLLKLLVPALYGFNVCGVYYFSRRTLGWDVGKALFAGLFFAFQLAALGLSWQFHRNMLGLGLLLFTLPLVKDIKSLKSFALFVLLSVLVVFGHEYASVSLFAVVLGVMASKFFEGNKRESLKMVFAIIPALILFLARVYLTIFPVPYHVETNVINARDTVVPRPGGLFFLVDYLGVALPFMHYPTYLHLVVHVFSLFSLLYLVWLPLVLVGFFRDKVLDGWTALLLVGSFNALITPFIALDLWFRWMLMLVYPFTFYAVGGLYKVLKQGKAAPSLKWFKWMKVSKKGVLGISLSIFLLGSIYMVTPLFFDRFGVFSSPTTAAYVPSTMLFNTVPLRDVNDVVEAFEWLNGRMNDGSCVLVQHPFLAWANLYLDDKHMIVYYQTDVEDALGVALNRGFNPVYLVWWNENIGWYGPDVPNYFIPAFSSDRISVFEYYDSLHA